jgi:hypothetical protein
LEGEKMKKLITVCATVMLIAGMAQATIVLDDFKTNANVTGHSWGLKCTTKNVPVYNSETGLAGTYGGSRDTMFNANGSSSSGINTSALTLGGEINGTAVGRLILGNPSFWYNLTELTYNGNGTGLDLDLTTGTKFSVNLSTDHLAFGKNSVLRITLNDGSQNAVVSKIWTTYVATGYEATYDFAFADFLSNNQSIDLGSIDSIKLYMETDTSGDYVMSNFTTDAIPEPATMCLLGLGALVLRRKKT